MSTNNKNPEKTISIHGDAALKSGPCDDCPWRKSNHGKRHPGGFFRKNNLQRLWNQIRKGGGMQTCHPTDPSHPDHCTCGGAKKGSTEQECAGSVVLITRELRHADRLGREEPVINMNGATLYLTESRQRKRPDPGRTPVVRIRTSAAETDRYGDDAASRQRSTTRSRLDRTAGRTRKQEVTTVNSGNDALG